MVTRLQAAQAEGFIDVTDRLGPEALRGKVPSGFRAVIKLRPGVNLSQISQRDFDTGNFSTKYTSVQLTPIKVGEEYGQKQFLEQLASQKLNPATIRGLQNSGILTSPPSNITQLTPTQKKEATQRKELLKTIKNANPKDVKQIIRKSNFLSGAEKSALISNIDITKSIERSYKNRAALTEQKQPIQSPTIFAKYGVLFAPRPVNTNTLNKIGELLDKDLKNFSIRAENGLATEAEYNRLNLIVNQYNKIGGRIEAASLRNYFKQTKPSPLKPEEITVEKLIPTEGSKARELDIGDIIPSELNILVEPIGIKGRESLIENIKGGAKSLGDVFENNVRSQLTVTPATEPIAKRIRNVGEIIGGASAIFDPAFKAIALLAQEDIKLKQNLGIYPKGKTFEVEIGKDLANIYKQVKESGVPIITEPLKYTDVGNNKIVISRRSIAEGVSTAAGIALLFTGEGETKAVKTTPVAEEISLVGKSKVRGVIGDSGIFTGKQKTLLEGKKFVASAKSNIVESQIKVSKSIEPIEADLIKKINADVIITEKGIITPVKPNPFTKVSLRKVPDTKNIFVSSAEALETQQALRESKIVREIGEIKIVKQKIGKLQSKIKISPLKVEKVGFGETTAIETLDASVFKVSKTAKTPEFIVGERTAKLIFKRGESDIIGRPKISGEGILEQEFKITPKTSKRTGEKLITAKLKTNSRFNLIKEGFREKKVRTIIETDFVGVIKDGRIDFVSKTGKKKGSLPLTRNEIDYLVKNSGTTLQRQKTIQKVENFLNKVVERDIDIAINSVIETTKFEEGLTLKPRSKVIEKLAPISIVATKPIVDNISKLVPKIVLRTIPRSQPKQVPKLVPKIVPKQVPKIITKPLPKLIPKIVVKPISKIVPKQVPKIVPKQVPKIVPKIVPKTIPKIIPRITITPIVPPLIPPILPPLVIPKPISKIGPIFKEKGAYNAFIKKGKKYIKLNSRPLKQKDAYSLGHYVIENTPSATLFVRKTRGKTPKNFNLPNIKLGQYRNPVSRSRLVKPSLVEKNKFRINTRGEKTGITIKGLVTRTRNQKILKVLNPLFKRKRNVKKVKNIKIKGVVVNKRR